MDIYGALSGEPLTPKRLLEIQKEDKQKEYQNYIENSYTPADKLDIATALTKASTDTQADLFNYQKSLITSPVSIDKNVAIVEDKIDQLKIKVDENSFPLTEMSVKQYGAFSTMVSNSSDPQKAIKEFQTAKLFSDTLGIKIEDAYTNKDALIKQFGSGRWGNNPNVIEDLKTSFAIGRKSSNNSDLGIERIKLEDGMAGLEGEELAKQQELLQANLDEQAKNNEWINAHASYLDDGIIKKLSRGVAENAYTMGGVLLASAGAGLAVATVGAALPIIAGTTAVLGPEAMFTASSMAMFGAATQTMLSTKQLTQGTSYNNLRESGISHETAKVTSAIIGSLTGFTEAAFDGVSLSAIKTIFGKKIGNEVLSTFIQKLALGSKATKVFATLGTSVTTANSEAFQEGTQELIDIIGTYMAESFEDNGYANLYESIGDITKKDLQKAYDSAAMGFGIGLVMGLPGTIFQTKMTINEFNEIQKLAKTVESKEAFVKGVADISPSTDTDLAGEMYTKLRDKETVKDKVDNILSPELDQEGNKIQTPSKGAEKVTVAKGPKRVNFDVQLAPRAKKQTVDGKDLVVTRLFDKENKQVGRATTIVADDSVKISKLVLEDDKLAKSTVKEIISKYPDKEVEWDTEDNYIFEEIKQELIDENPKGEEFGLNYYDLTETGETKIAEKIRGPFNLTKEQSIIASTLVKLHAESEGMTTNEWWGNTVKSIKPATTEGIRGSVKFNPDATKLKAVIYTAKQADVSTFTHEVFHLTINQMENKNELAKAVQDWAKNEEFITFYNENAEVFDADFATTVKAIQSFDLKSNKWTTRQDEALASLYEAWEIQGTTKIPELDSIMRKISKWFKEIYTTVKQTVKMDETVSDYFDSMYAKQKLDEETENVTNEETFEYIEKQSEKSESKILYQVDKNYKPKNIGHGYKLFEQNMETGELYPLFIGKKEPTPMNDWIIADNPGKQKGFALRPGWHIGSSLPDAPWLKGYKGEDKPAGVYNSKRGKKFERVWAKVSYPMDINYQAELNESGQKDIKGHIPTDGFYNFREANGLWIISGALKVDEILDEQARQEIFTEAGYDETAEFMAHPSTASKIKKWNEKNTAKLKELNQKNNIRMNEDGEVLMDLVDDNGDKWLFQSPSRTKIRNDAVKEAMLFKGVTEFRELYEIEHPDEKHQQRWYERVYEEGIKKASEENVKTLYTRGGTETKNNIFSTGLKEFKLVDDFIKEMKAFKKVIDRIDTKAKVSIDNQIKLDFYKEINKVIPEEILAKQRLSKKSREQIVEINQKYPTETRLIFAKLFGIEYMMGEHEFSDIDYFEEETKISDKAKSDMAKSIIEYSEPEAKRRMQEGYKKALGDMEISRTKLKEEIAKLKKEKVAAIAKLKANKEYNSERIKELNAEYKNRERAIKADANYKYDVLKYKTTNNKLLSKLKEKPKDSVRVDYSDKMKIISSLFDKTTRNAFRTINNGKWDTTMLNDIIKEEMGSFIAEVYNPEKLSEMADAKINSNDDLDFFYQLRNNLREEGMKRRKADLDEISSRNTFYRDLCSESLKEAVKKLENDNFKKISDKLPVTRLFFKANYNIVRKALLLDGYKKGAFTEILVNQRRLLKDIKDANVDRRMTKITDIMEKNDVNFIDISKTVLSTEFDGKTQRHSISDLFYYWYSQNNEDNKIAVSCGVLMNESERQSSDISDEQFIVLAEDRYREVLAEAKKYVDEPKYSEIFEAIWDEFNDEGINKINEVIKKAENKQVKAMNFYLPIMRKEFNNEEIETQFTEDINGRQYTGHSTTKYGSLKGRKIISLRSQKPIDTNMMALLQTTVDKQEHLLAFYDYVNEVTAIFSGPDSSSLQANIIDNFGSEMYNDITTFIEEVANPYAKRQEYAIDKVAKVLVGKLYPAYLGGKVSTVIMQFVTSPAAFMAKMNPIEYMGSFNHILLNRKEVIKKVNDLSPFMKNRAWDYAWSDIKKIIERQGGEKNAIILQHEFWMEKLMGGLQIADSTTVYSGWNQIYETELEKLGSKTEMNQKKAAKIADNFVRDTQPNSDVVEIAPIFKGSEATKVFTRFTASLSPIFQNISFDSFQMFKEDKYTELFGMLFGYASAGALLFAVRGGYDKGDDAEDKMKKFLYSLLSQPLSSVPLIGNLLDYTVESNITGKKRGLYGSSLMPPIDALFSSFRKIDDGDFKKGVALMMESFGLLVGLPVSATKEVAKAIDSKSILPLLGYKN